ncbi:MAG: undecaprenyl-diphosphate phosphatase [Candidatus Roizmanbacteria bacterium]|nr:MAG: undecaprenyl-diphosphate phosphatase [Candidatus Roizmanbacteria bacterium]
MNVVQAIILGVVEGATEFLPVSSTFHLIFTSKLLGIPQSDFIKLFEVFIQAGAILSVLFLYFKDIWSNKELLKKLLFSFVPTAVVGLLLYKVIKNVFFESDFLMLGVFGGLGIFFIVFEYLIKKDRIKLSKKISDLSVGQAIIVGLIQALAILPGVSRAGAVMLGMMFMRYNRDEAAKYSFMLAIPTIFAASFYDLYKMRDVAFAYSNNFLVLIIGFVTAFISSYFIVKWFIGFLKSNTLIPFGVYRIILAIILLLYLF